MGAYSSKSKTNPEQSGGGVSNTTKTTTTKKKTIEITSIDRAILDLKNTRDKLQRYRTRLLMEDEKLMMKVKQAKVQNKTSYALQLLKLHHYKMQQYENCNTQLINILQMVQTIDSTQNDIHIITALQKGKDTLQQLQNEISIDHLMELMDEISEQHETEQEIANIIQENIPNLITTATATGTINSDEELLKELEALQQQDVTSTTPATATAALPELPTVPTHKLPDIIGITTTTTTTTTTPVLSQQPNTKEERIAVLG